jgi:DNA polymerase-3 subunit gamma/tau
MTFEEVIGQSHVTTTLKNALRSGRIRHAYLFAGPRGTGKTTMGRLLAKAVNCLSEDERPCNECHICNSINEGRLLDLIEIDAASNRGIDEVRSIREKVGFRPNEARYKVYILDEAHMLTEPAFNALLKTLEEPPPHVIFVLVTTEPHKIPLTILSRCQRFDFRRIPLKDIIDRLKRIATQEGLKAEPKALELIARNATGSMRDAESLLDQLASYGEESITLSQVRSVLGTAPHEAVGELISCIESKDIAGGLHIINRSVEEGADPRQLSRQLVEYLHALLIIKASGDGRGAMDEDLLNVSAEILQRMKAQSARTSISELLRLVNLFNRAASFASYGLQPQLPLELAFIEATLLEEDNYSKGPSRKATEVKVEARAEVKTEAGKVAILRSTETETKGTMLEEVKRNWARVLSEIRARNRLVEALLKSCEPIAYEEGLIVLGFYYPFHKEKIEDPKRKALVERVISRVVGKPCLIKCALSPRGKQLANDPLIKTAMEKYEAKVVVSEGERYANRT